MIIAIQYWKGDESAALGLARLIADIEPRWRTDHIMVLARAWDCELSDEAKRTRDYCGKKLQTMTLQSPVKRVGHPDGCYGIWAGTVGKLYQLWSTGLIAFDHSSVFCAEADGCPLRRDWIDRLWTAHYRSVAQGFRITGATMDQPMPHVNGNFVMHLSVWQDFPSLHDCMPKAAWDVQHATVLLPLTRNCGVIRNEYETRDWTEGCIVGVAREATWIHGVKDESVLRIVRGWMRTKWSVVEDDR